MRRKQFNKIAKRTLSVITAMVLFSGSLPMAEISEKLDVFKTALVAHAVEDYSKNPTLYSAQNIIDYSKAYNAYPENHYDDNITINLSDGEAKTSFAGFQSLGTSLYPFAGTITFNPTATHDINIDTAFFDYVYDYVTIDGGIDSGVEKYMTIKPLNDNSDALLANHVLHDSGTLTGAVYGTEEGQKTPANWTIEIAGYEGSSHTHGSLIGEMGEDAECTVNLINDYSVAVENYIGDGAITDTGAVCGVMKTGSKLTIAKVTGSAAASITSSSGNAGGLVGTMNPGSTLTISGSSGDYVSPTSSITAANGYAGGIVGYNDQATVLGGYAAIKNTITGSLGAGGLYGYYKPIITDSAYTLSLDDFSIGSGTNDRCRVSSPIGAGGFFGVLDNPGTDITVTGGTNTIYARGRVNDTVFGGIIGKYQASGLSDTLSVSGTSSAVPLTVNLDRSDNTACYGGIIGNVDGTAFVSVSDISVTAANSNREWFGGVAGIADDAYLYVKNITLNTTSSYNGGAIVGKTSNGVVHLSGDTNLSSATATSGINYGQIVGYRDSALVFAESGWNLTRYIDSSTNKGTPADDVGSWGEVVRFSTSLPIGDVLSAYYNPSAETICHYAKLKAASTTLSSKGAFALAALNMQLNSGTTSDAFALQFENVTDSAYSNLKSSNFTMIGDIDLSLTGLTGLTRDNSNSDWTSGISPEYAGTLFDGGGNKLTLAIGEGYDGQNAANTNTSGRGRIYRHRYNGLFGILANDFTVKDLTVDGKISTYTKTSDAFYVGAIAGIAQKKSNVSDVTIGQLTSGNSDMKIDFGIDNAKDNNVEIYVGGLAGKMEAPGNSIIGTGGGGASDAEYTGTVNSAFRAEIAGTSPSDKTYVGGIAGYVGSGSPATAIKIYDVEIGGKVENSSAKPRQRIGGLFANVAGGSVTIDGVSASSLTVSGAMGTNTINSNDSEKRMGGLFGYCWDADSTFDHVSISSCTLGNNGTGGDMAGLVNMGKGHWVFNSLAIDGLTLSGTSAASFGMLLNKAYSGSNAMYLELPSGFTYTITGVTGTAPSIYDEIAAYTVMPNNAIEANGNSVISINTSGTTQYGTMTASGEDASKVHMTSGSCNTYQNQVTAEGFNKYNPNSRYYYNVDNYIGKNNSGAAALYLWSVYQYAHSSIQKNIASTAPSSNFSGDLDLDGYSYYPVDVSGTVKFSGDVALHNKDIEDRESENSGDGYKRTTIKDATNNSTTQHYLMHAGLFRNVSGTININGVLTIDGTVPYTGDYCGALICGTIGGSTSADAVITSNNTGASISLAGIKVHNKDSDYSPLLINKASGYVVMDIYNVSADSLEYSPGDTIATSLIGAIGSDDAQKIQLTFNNITLDGRTADNTAESTLTSVYGTTRSLFTKATLLHSLTYASGSGSSGVYNYEYGEDWVSSNHVGNVTYGKEISSSDSKNYKKEFWYNNENHSSASAHYTDPSTDDNCGNSDATAPYDFGGFYPYVAVWGTQIGSSATKHQLNVNHSSATFSGCGTYNDPYIITTGDQLESISKILSGKDDDETFWLFYPNDSSNKWCESKTSHTRYIFKKSAFTTKEGATVAATTNGKYYKQEQVIENGEAVYYVTNASVGTTIEPDVIRAYLAGAYYYLENNIEINDANFEGLGCNSNAAYVFHGVIAGNSKTITNKTVAPLIYASNGCVVKNLTIKPDGINNPVSTTGSFASTGGANTYGALIGRVMGGDNIIDQVTVDTSSANVTAGNYLATIGSYVGVVVEGGVFFRNMDKVKNNVLFSDRVFAESDNGHLYCNPIIGRVINGFAVNESDAYRPYEDGTRSYGDGSKEYWQSNGTIVTKTKAELDADDTLDDTMKATAVGVTIKNGNKNYSITDIDSSLSPLSISDTAITVPNSQAFFVMSLIINSGMGTNGTPVVGYYGTNQITRHAEYNNVGSDVKLSDYDTAAEYNATDARKDYAKTIGTTGDNKDNPYLISAYTTGNNIKQLGSGSDFTLNVNDDIILPDGYKGIGNVFNNSTSLYLALSTFDGKNHTISQNTTFYSYTNGDSNKNEDNYLPYTKNPSNQSTVHGLGLFNYVNHATFKDCILNGNVITNQYHSGKPESYVSSQNYTALSVGMLAGTLNMGGNASITDVYLQNTYSESPKETAGMIGFLINTTDKRKISIINTASNSNQSFGIRVNAGTSAAGLIARQGRYDADKSQGAGEIEIKLNGHHFDYVSIISRYDGSFNNNGWNADWALGVGGLVGIARGGTEKNTFLNNHITIDGVNIGNATRDTSRVVACEYTNSNNATVQGSVYSGGLVGVANKAPVDATNCNIYNVTVRSALYSGGVLGWGGTWSNIKLDNFKIFNKLDAKIYTSDKDSKAGCVVGFCKGGGDGDSMGTLKMLNSTIEGYIVEGYDAGGAMGDWNSSKPFSLVNSVINDCKIVYKNAGGGIAGQLQQKLNGYNVRVSDISFTGTSDNKGYICGYRNTGGIIKIAGFHRTGTISEAKLIGNYATNKMTDMYGAGGYVIFADFEGKSALDPPSNTTVSDVNLNGDTSVDDFGAAPFVTINPAAELSITGKNGILTGDGMVSSAVNSILTDTSNKKYAVAGRADIVELLNEIDGVQTVKTDVVSTFKAELGDTVKDAGYDFPMLVINDTNTADAVLNHYLRALTNTDDAVDYSYRTNDQTGYLRINNQGNTNFGIVTIRKCKYENGTITISSNTNDASLIVNSSNVFQIRKTSNKEQYDTATPGQFTLIDVAFKDPSDTSKVAYHLYVPVIVKKLIEYNFDISAVSGSTYDQSLYTGNRGNNVVENLGAPVTMEFEYNYLRSATEWAAESDNAYGLDKYLSFDPQTVELFDNTTTKLVLVDINRGGKEYYLSKWSDGYNTTTKLLNLQAFKDAGGTAFAPVTFANMLSEQKISGDQTLKEKYYLTIFTAPFVRPKLLDENDEPILDENGKEQIDTELVKVIHYSVTTHNIGTTEHPTRRVDCTDQAAGSYHYVTHLVIGDFYTNTISVATPSNATERMSNNNKTVTVDLSASIDLVNSGTRRLLRDYLGKSNVTIYQSLLASFEKYNNNSLYDKGLTAIDGYSISSYTLTGQNGNIPIADRQILRTANFIEFQNNTDISSSLQNGSVISTVQAILEFNSENTRKAQFPYRSDGQNTGALVIGYSNISSSKTNTAYSVVSVSDDDTYNKMYYVESEETAELQYYADYSDANKQNQLNEQLGINAREIESSQTKSFIQTEGRYDTTGLLNASKAKYLECSLKLYQKQENGSYSEVSIDSYLDSLSVISGKTPVYTNPTTHTFIFAIDDVVQFENEQYVYKVPITFNAITGNQTNFKDTYYYANYKVELTVSLFDHDGSTDTVPWSDHMSNSTVSDWVIYTNARVYTDLINTSAS